MARIDPQLLALAQAVRELRGRRTQEELGLSAGGDQAWISNIEAGRVDLRWTTVARIAGGLGVSVAELAARAEAIAKEKGGPAK